MRCPEQGKGAFLFSVVEFSVLLLFLVALPTPQAFHRAHTGGQRHVALPPSSPWSPSSRVSSFHNRPSSSVVLLQPSSGARSPLKLNLLQPASAGTPEQLVSDSTQQTNKALVDFFKDVLTLAFVDRPYPYFYALETIARVPYFAYASVLHLYETLGLLRRKEMVLLHFAESWNELHHLLIMESLGGNAKFSDRFISQHLAFGYYWIVVGLYLTAPHVAYDFNKHVEQHAFETYDKYLTEHADELKAQPAPQVALDYYCGPDPFLLDACQTSAIEDSVALRTARPKASIRTLYDVFVEIRNDEKEHAETMGALSQDPRVRQRA